MEFEKEKIKLRNRDIETEYYELKLEYEAHKRYSKKILDREREVILRLRMLQEA